MLVMKSAPFGNVEESKQMYELVQQPEQEIKTVKLSNIKDPEEKEYLVCLFYDDTDTLYTSWDIYKGRTQAYQEIIDAIHNSNYDFGTDCVNIEYSFVLVEGAKLEERVKLYDFMKYCKNFYNDGFDIDDYIDDEDHAEPMKIANPDRVDNNLLNMISLMNKEYNQQDIYNED